MGSPPLITLTTDFGSRDGFAGAMKGAILSLNRAASIIDITHDIPAHDIAHGAFVLGTTCPYFPPDTIHVGVVDIMSDGRSLLHAKLVLADLIDPAHPVRHDVEKLAQTAINVYHKRYNGNLPLRLVNR